MYSNQSFGEKSFVINNFFNKFDAVNKKDLEFMDDDRFVFFSFSSLSYLVIFFKISEDGSEDFMFVFSVCSLFVFQIFFFFLRIQYKIFLGVVKELRLFECLNDFEGFRFIEVKYQLYN